ncbi:GRB2-associated-binding protein 2 isoform X1 [Paramormyrops kingsleyae]|uniref:GRB2-associated-binding protein 2 isoform X1 n=1 Tax=Paramormyrops kingsleyae TaxID=1676925 RepID=UPI000CD612C6|nr:GRB2-associated-binding protein 2-like isoform X1 [Paramormyrops kingsleyae]
MSGGEIVCQGWLRKSPPEKKLRRYAWKKRWFVLRSGRMSGDLNALEYYKNDHSKKPIRVIDLDCCEQVDAGLTFKRKDFQDSFVFDIRTSDRTFYLVAETEEEMNKWVRAICQLCGFNQAEENYDGGRTVAGASHTPRSLAAELGAPFSSLIGDRKSTLPAHSSQPVLFTFDIPALHVQGPLSNSVPQDYLFLHQCMSRKSESARSASFSQATRGSLLSGSDSPSQRVSRGFPHCLNGTGAQTHGFYSLPKPGRHPSRASTTQPESPRDSCCDVAKGPSWDWGGSEVYTFKTPNNALAASLCADGDPPPDNRHPPTPPSSFYQTPRTFDKNHNAVSVSDGPAAPPPRPPKPGQRAEQCRAGSGAPAVEATSVGPRRNTLPAVENIRLHRGSSFENSEHPPRQIYFASAGQSAESVNEILCPYLQRPGLPLKRSDSSDSDDNYVPMNPGSGASPSFGALPDSPQNVYIPMSPRPHHFDFPSFSATLPARKGSSASLCQRPGRLSDVTPPPINRNLKPDRRARPVPLDLRSSSIIDELPFKSPVTLSWTRPVPVASTVCRPSSTQSVTSTDSADSEENYVAMQNPTSASPAASGTGSPAPRKSGNVDYLALDFQAGSPNPHRKPSTSSVSLDEKVDYVQVDKEKTQALQSTMQEWTDVRQSSEPTKGLKS